MEKRDLLGSLTSRDGDLDKQDTGAVGRLPRRPLHLNGAQHSGWQRIGALCEVLEPADRPGQLLCSRTIG
jgi:hypothetical protein